MKVLHVLGCINKGGTENFVFNHSLKLKNEIDFVFMTIGSAPTAYIDTFKENNWKCYVAPNWNKRNIKKMYDFFKEIQKKEHIDIVHAHLNCDNYFIILIAFLLGIKIRICHSHDTAGLESHNISKKVVNKLKVFIINNFTTNFLACSEEAGEYLFGKKFKIKGHVINNGIDLYSFFEINNNEINDIRKNFNLEGKKIIGNISRFEEKKNQIFILDVFKEIIQNDDNYILILGGPDAGYLNRVKLYAKELNIDDKVIYLDVVDNVKNWLKLFDVFLFPSKFEGLGIILLECQACGTSFVASDNVPLKVDLGLNISNFLSLNLDKKEWAKCVIEATNNKVLKQDEIVNAFTERNFTLDQSVKLLRNVYLNKL